MAGHGLDENRMRRQNAANNGGGARKPAAESMGRSRIHEAIAQARARLAAAPWLETSMRAAIDL